MVLQSAAVVLALLLQTGCNSIPRDNLMFIFTKISRMVLRVPQAFIQGLKWFVYKADHTLFTAPKLKTPGTLPLSPYIFMP
jgi:hypothetical protein